jgi:hypothetical protein
MSMQGSGFTVATRVALGALALAAATVHAGTTTVYKCFDRNLGVLYTDEPCKGEQMNIRAGDADPGAVAELQREREALARSSALRIADNRRTNPDRDYAAQWINPPADTGLYASADAYYPGGYAYAPYAANARRRPPATDRDERRERAAFLPNPPRGLPRK